MCDLMEKKNRDLGLKKKYNPFKEQLGRDVKY